MSLLQDLVQELQQRIEGQAVAPSTAAVADAAGSERINVTLPRGVMAVSYTHLTLPTNREV